MMKQVSIALFVLSVVVVGGLYVWARVHLEPVEARPSPIVIESPPTHIVTPEMATASRAMVNRPALGFAKPATDGKVHRLEEMLRQGPLLLIFIKEGCPCSEAAQVFFNDLHAAYPQFSIRGVIDVEVEPAKRWAERFDVEYPIVLDPETELVRSYGVENSAYVVLINSQGEIEKHWPGFSEPMLQELNALMAEMTGAVEAKLDLADAPTELYSGCPYDL